MARDWHELFKTWSKPPSDTEETKGANAAGMIRKAIRASENLSGHNIDIYATGSYRNNTNVKLDSDIDVAVVLRDSIFSELPDGLTKADVGISSPASYGWQAFRDDVGQALRDFFGRHGVEKGDKSYKLRENSYRLNADVTPFLVHRRYTGDKTANGDWKYLEGVELRSRSLSKSVVNWHQQHYDNGVAKNSATNRRYKRIVRILKKLRQDMSENGSWEAKQAVKEVNSFLLECLVYNVPNTKFNLSDGSYYDDVKAVIAASFHQTKNDAADASNRVEVSELKYLFAKTQPWTQAQAHSFIKQSWYHVGFTND